MKVLDCYATELEKWRVWWIGAMNLVALWLVVSQRDKVCSLNHSGMNGTGFFNLEKQLAALCH